MNVLFVHEKCGYFGGVEQSVAEAARGLTERGHRCALAYKTATENDTRGFASLFECTERCDELRDDDQKLRSLVRVFEPDVIFFHKLQRLFGRHATGSARRVRMVHDHDLTCARRHAYSAFTGRICHHRLGWRCVVNGGLLEKSPQSRFGIRLVNLPGKAREIARHRDLDRILVASRFMYRTLARNGIHEDRLAIVPPVVRHDPAPLVPLSSEPHVLFVGQLIRGKGVDLLLRALALVRVPFRATIAGHGNSRASLEKLCKNLGLLDRVRFVGFAKHERLRELYDDARLLVVPSRWPEPFGMVGVEAMLRGRPVVAFDVGGVSDWLKHRESGLLVAEQDVAGLASAVTEMLTDTALAQRFGKNGLRRAQTIYTLSRYIRSLESHLRGDHDA